MQKKYISLGLMSGTSGDGVDASVISSNGTNEFESIEDKYYEYDNDIYKSIHSLKQNINSQKDLKKNNRELLDLEKKITFFHAKIIKDLDKYEEMLIGFHGQTIYHNSEEKISKQLGNGKLLNQLTKKKIIFNFRKNDILNDGEGAPLAPIFHQLIVAKHSIETPVCLLNIGGISNLTVIIDKFDNQKLFSRDLGPGNCLIDNWIRNSSKFKYDSNGKFAETGELNDIILEQAQELYANRINKEKLSFDVNDFDISFARGLSLKDGAATLTQFTAEIISERISFYLSKLNCNPRNILLCGGGRKNKFLIKKIKNLIPINLKLNSVDDLNVNGDFIESQAFGYIAIRSYKNLPITFPNTTGCKMPCSGGEIIEN